MGRGLNKEAALVRPRVEEVSVPPDDFFVDGDVDPVGTHLQAETPLITYAKLVEAVGRPCYEVDEKQGDGKVTTEWLFRGQSGLVFTLYDYKETDAYCTGLPTPAEFRAEPVGYRWHIGGNGDPGEFKAWLLSKVAAVGNRETR